MGGGLGLCHPDQQSTDRVALVEGSEQTPHLVTVPDVPPLELRQGHVAAVDVVEDGGDFHGSGIVRIWLRCKKSSAISPSQMRLTVKNEG